MTKNGEGASDGIIGRPHAPACHRAHHRPHPRPESISAPSRFSHPALALLLSAFPPPRPAPTKITLPPAPAMRKRTNHASLKIHRRETSDLLAFEIRRRAGHDPEIEGQEAARESQIT